MVVRSRPLLYNSLYERDKTTIAFPQFPSLRDPQPPQPLSPSPPQIHDVVNTTRLQRRLKVPSARLILRDHHFHPLSTVVQKATRFARWKTDKKVLLHSCSSLYMYRYIDIDTYTINDTYEVLRESAKRTHEGEGKNFRPKVFNEKETSLNGT